MIDDIKLVRRKNRYRLMLSDNTVARDFDGATIDGGGYRMDEKGATYCAFFDLWDAGYVPLSAEDIELLREDQQARYIPLVWSLL